MGSPGGQTLRVAAKKCSHANKAYVVVVVVAAKKCMAWTCFSVKKAKSLDIECRILP